MQWRGLFTTFKMTRLIRTVVLDAGGRALIHWLWLMRIASTTTCCFKQFSFTLMYQRIRWLKRLFYILIHWKIYKCLRNDDVRVVLYEIVAGWWGWEARQGSQACSAWVAWTCLHSGGMLPPAFLVSLSRQRVTQPWSSVMRLPLQSVMKS